MHLSLSLKINLGNNNPDSNLLICVLALFQSSFSENQLVCDRDLSIGVKKIEILLLLILFVHQIDCKIKAQQPKLTQKIHHIQWTAFTETQKQYSQETEIIIIVSHWTREDWRQSVVCLAVCCA